MKNCKIAFACFSLALLCAALSPTSLSAQVKAETGQDASTKTFTSKSDCAIVDILRGPIEYKLYVRKVAKGDWVLIETKRVEAPTEAIKEDVKICNPGTYQIKLVLTTNGADAATVKFAQQ